MRAPVGTSGSALASQGRSVRELVAHFRPFFAYAGIFSLAINVLLLVPPLYMLQVFDRVISSRSHETLLLLSVAGIAALGVMAALEAVRSRLLAAAGMALDRTLGPRVLDGLVDRSSRLAAPEHVHGLRDVNMVRTFLTGNGVLAIFDAPWLPVFLVIIFLFHPLLGAMALAGAVLMWLLAFVNERLARRPLERVQAGGRRAGRFIDMSTRNAEVIAGLGMLRAVTERWARMNDEVLREQVGASAIGGRLAAATKFARQFIQLVILAAGAYLVIDQQVTPGVMIAATLLLSRALAPVETLVGGWRSLVEARGAWRRLDELLGTNPPAEPGTDLPAPQGSLEVERAVFALRGMERPILRGVSFSLGSGESLGIIGPSASGKSTLARLIMGIWKPASGTVRLDGADVAVWPREKLGPHMGYLPQDVELFTGTVAQNIARLGDPDAEELIRAARRAHVHDLILRLAQGYDTEIGEAGQALSPGQRQRIGLARALYGNPRLVVLDEPNANLDREGDVALVRTLSTLKEEGVTVVIVTHRPSLLSGIDKMLVLRDGAIDAFGPCADVMARVTRAVRPAKEAA